MSLEYIETRTATETRTLVIWLHGLGADGHDFEGLVPELDLPPSAGINFIFPHAPYRSITLNNGYVMRGWYDIDSLAFDHQQDELGIRESAELLRQLIQQQLAVQDIAAENVILAGFSQGGALVLHTALRYAQTLGGIMVLSSYLPLADTLAEEKQAANEQTAIFMAHGLQDEVVRYEYGVQSRQALQQAGYPVAWHDYSMGHAVSADEIRDIRSWLLERAG